MGIMTNWLCSGRIKQLEEQNRKWEEMCTDALNDVHSLHQKIDALKAELSKAENERKELTQLNASRKESYERIVAALEKMTADAFDTFKYGKAVVEREIASSLGSIKGNKRGDDKS